MAGCGQNPVEFDRRMLYTYMDYVMRKKGVRMASYQSFAQVYDLFMDNIDYDSWSRYLIGLLKEYGVSDGLVLELGCGTGSMTQRLAQAGYDMIGADLSADMLDIAMEKREASGLDILYLLQDMREFELYGTVRAVVSICDSMNYMLEEEDLLDVCKLVNNYLDPGGMFIFDLNTEKKYRAMGETTIAENRDEASFIWENYFDEEEKINEYDLTLFIRDEEDGRYDKFEEFHEQRAYPLALIREIIERSGLEFVTMYDAFTHEPATEDSERVYVIAREHGKAQ